jgi:hypothetical protein
MAATTVMTFTTLDQAESALDWIGLDFGEAEGCFEGDLFPEDAELLDETIGDTDSPEAVRELATALQALLQANPAGASWRVAFEF